jgi:hypothetical protein
MSHPSFQPTHEIQWTVVFPTHLTTGKTGPLITDERAGFERGPVQVEDHKQTGDRFRRIRGIL